MDQTPSALVSSSVPLVVHGTNSTGSGTSGELDCSSTAQLANQANHLTLCAYGDDEELPTAEQMDPLSSGVQGPDASVQQPLTFPADAQRHPQLRPTEVSREKQLGVEGTQRWRDAGTGIDLGIASTSVPSACHRGPGMQPSAEVTGSTDMAGSARRYVSARQLPDLPNEVLLQILGYLEVNDLLSTSRTSRHLRQLSLAPILHRLRLRQARATLPPMLTSPSRPSLAELIRRRIFQTRTTVISRKLARNLVAIKLARRLASRPSAEALVDRCVLPPECVPGRAGQASVAPALVAKKRAVERERVKDALRRWVGSVWTGEVRTREEGVRLWEERVGVGRVWRLRRFWERVGSGEQQVSGRGGPGS